MHSGGCSGFNDSTYAAARSGSVDDYGANTLLIGTVHRDAAVCPRRLGPIFIVSKIFLVGSVMFSFVLAKVQLT